MPTSPIPTHHFLYYTHLIIMLLYHCFAILSLKAEQA